MFISKSKFRAGLAAVLLAFLVSLLLQLLWRHKYGIVAAWLIIEGLFFLIVTGPAAEELDQTLSPGPARIDQQAFSRFLQYCREAPRGVNAREYLTGWFQGAPFESIKRGNIEEFVIYGFWYRSREQMETLGLGRVPAQAVDQLEAVWGISFEPGYNPDIRYMAHLWEPLKPGFRPLAFYLMIEGIAHGSRLMLRRWGFHRHRAGGLNYYTLGLLPQPLGSTAGITNAGSPAPQRALSKQPPVAEEPCGSAASSSSSSSSCSQSSSLEDSAMLPSPEAAAGQAAESRSQPAQAAAAAAAAGPDAERRQQWLDWQEAGATTGNAEAGQGGSEHQSKQGHRHTESFAFPQQPPAVIATTPAPASAPPPAPAAADTAPAADAAVTTAAAARAQQRQKQQQQWHQAAMEVLSGSGVSNATAAGLQGDEVLLSPFASTISMDLDAHPPSFVGWTAPQSAAAAKAAATGAGLAAGGRGNSQPVAATGRAASLVIGAGLVSGVPPAAAPVPNTDAAIRAVHSVPAAPAAAAGGRAARPTALQQRASCSVLGARLSKQTSYLLEHKPNPLKAALTDTDVMAAHIPIVFLHGIGGLPAYLELLLYMMALGNPLLVVEMRSVAMRLGRVKSVDEVAHCVLSMMDKMGVQKACLVAHSYGTFVASYLAKHHPARVHGCVLVDPVCLGMFMPNLIHNFLYNKPKLRSWSVKDITHYLRGVSRNVVAKEMHVRASVSRRFYWSEMNAWPEDLPAGSVILISGQDDLMNSPAARDMFESAAHVKVIYNEDLAHASFLAKAAVKDTIKQEIKTILARSGKAVAGLASTFSSLVKPPAAAAAAAAAAAGRAVPQQATDALRQVLSRSWSMSGVLPGGSGGIRGQQANDGPHRTASSGSRLARVASPSHAAVHQQQQLSGGKGAAAGAGDVQMRRAAGDVAGRDDVAGAAADASARARDQTAAAAAVKQVKGSKGE